MIGTRFYGRLGNVFFQAAHTIALALKRNQEFSLPNYTNDSYWNPLYLQHLVNPKWVQGKEDILLNENGMQYQHIEWKDEWKDLQVVLNGYWQSEKYFKEYRNEILYLFDFPYQKKEGYVSCHVRHGDYLHLRMKHPEITKEWYEVAMKEFPGYKFKFFSDDIKWCKENFGNRNDCEFSTNTNEVDDITEMSHCEHNISSNSTFSWWGALLSDEKNKIVLCPEFWLNPDRSTYKDDFGDKMVDFRRALPDEWIKIPNIVAGDTYIK